MQTQGTFNGTGAAVHIGLGYVPDYVDIWAAGDAELAHARWNRGFRVAAAGEGYVVHGGDQAVALYTAGTGIYPEVGGVTLTAALQTSVTYGEGVYLDFVGQKQDFRYGPNLGPYQTSDGATVTIDSWTLDTSGSRTGHYNGDVTGTYIGPGSQIKIDGVWYYIEALTAGQGVTADEVTLSFDAPTGAVQYISGMYDCVPLAVGKTTQAGFLLSATTEVNVNDQIQSFVAGTYDN